MNEQKRCRTVENLAVGPFLYSGDIVEDQFEGKGLLVSSQQTNDGTPLYYYKGQFRQGKRHGPGMWELHHTSGAFIELYDGWWCNDQRSGRCTIASYDNGDRYSGEVAFNLFHGRGRLEMGDGRVYEGEFAQGKRHGQGRLQFPNKDVHEGTFVEGRLEGPRCRMVFSNETREFVGEIVNGKRVRGMMRYVDQGKQYDGEWQDDRPHGKGIMKLSNGDTYRGDLLAGKFHGEGVYDYVESKKRHVGQFAADRPHGVGVLKTLAPVFKTVKGTWSEGKRQNE